MNSRKISEETAMETPRSEESEENLKIMVYSNRLIDYLVGDNEALGTDSFLSDTVDITQFAGDQNEYTNSFYSPPPGFEYKIGEIENYMWQNMDENLLNLLYYIQQEENEYSNHIKQFSEENVNSILEYTFNLIFDDKEEDITIFQKEFENLFSKAKIIEREEVKDNKDFFYDELPENEIYFKIKTIWEKQT